METRITGPGFDGTVKDYLEVRLGFGPGMIWWSAVMLTGFCSLFFAIYAASVKLINFQKRWSTVLKILSFIESNILPISKCACLAIVLDPDLNMLSRKTSIGDNIY